MTYDQFIAYLQNQVEVHRTQKILAQRCGVTPAFLSDVLHGNRGPGKKLLAALGLQEVVYYEPIGSKGGSHA